MNDLRQAVLDGLSVAGLQWAPVAGMVLLLVLSLVLLILLLRRIFGKTFAPEEYASLALAGWLLPALPVSLLWYAGAQIVSSLLSLLSLGFLVLVGLFILIQNGSVRLGSPNLVSLSLYGLAGLFILLRLAYVSKAVLPLYFDSAQHHRFIKELLVNLEVSGAGTLPLTGYYHLGFHFLAAFLAFLTRAEITDTMLVLGQVILALMPFSAFFLVRHGSGSNSAGFLALALAAFGWYMPAHAVDWGKYPALASLALIPFVLAITYLYIQNRHLLPSNKNRFLMILLLAAALISVLLHSRSMVVYALLTSAWLVTFAWNRMGKWLQFLALGILILILVGEVMYIRTQGILGPLLEAYGQKTLPIGIFVLVLSVFAWRSYPRLVFFCTLSISLFLGSLFVPLRDLIPGYVNTTLLDRPYVQMILYLPLTLLAGFGMASLEHMLGNTRLVLSKVIAVFFILLVAINGLLRYDLYPDDCCAIASRDDLAAIHWMDANLPEDALIVTSSTDLKVLPTDNFQGSAGGDAGTWITPLTGRPVTYLPFDTDFSQQQTLDILCQQQVRYVYVGKTGWFFDDAKISTQPGGYRLLLDLPKASVYEITGCK